MQSPPVRTTSAVRDRTAFCWCGESGSGVEMRLLIRACPAYRGSQANAGGGRGTHRIHRPRGGLRRRRVLQAGAVQEAPMPRRPGDRHGWQEVEQRTTAWMQEVGRRRMPKPRSSCRDGRERPIQAQGEFEPGPVPQAVWGAAAVPVGRPPHPEREVLSRLTYYA